MEAPAATPPSFEGVPLAQLTHIAAARAEGFSIEEILSVEGLASEEFFAADLAYKEKLCEPNIGPRLIAAYERDLAQAEERLARRVRPLDEDLGAWTRFLAAYAASEAPKELLSALGMTLPDLSRLGRVWKQRIEANRELARRAEKLARENAGKPMPPVVHAEPAKLVPSPHARPKPAPAKAPAQVLAKEHRPKKPAIPPAISGTALMLDIPRGPALPFVEGPDEPSAVPLPRVDGPPREALSGTSLALEVPRGPALPFAGNGDSPRKNELAMAQAPPALAGTALALDVPRGPALPFVETKESPAPAQPNPSPPPTEAPRPALSGTSLALDVPRGPDTPFEALAATKLDVPIPRDLVRKIVSSSAAPKLSLEEHAALTVELAMAKERAAEVLSRHRITQAEREALDRHYQAVVSADEQKRAAWHAAYQAHYAQIAASFNRR